VVLKLYGYEPFYAQDRSCLCSVSSVYSEICLDSFDSKKSRQKYVDEISMKLVMSGGIVY
jgi:hypothetical protein